MPGSYMLCIMRHRVKFQKRSVYFGLMRVLKGPLVCQRVSSFRQHETETCTNPRQGNEQRHDTLPCRAPNRIQIFPFPALFCSFMLEAARCIALCAHADLPVGHEGESHCIISQSPKQNSKHRHLVTLMRKRQIK